jgi:protein-tyrosine phosphatase
MTQPQKPPNPLRRIVSLLRVGPLPVFLRFYDQWRRKLTGAPDFRLTRIRPFLHVGGQHYKKGWAKMQAEGINGIVNMREEHHNDALNEICGDAHLHLATLDNMPVSMEFLHQAADFINEQQEKGGIVYVHCGVGVGRAPSAAAAYLMKYENMTAIEAIKTIRQTRPFVHLVGTQLLALQQFEQEVHNGAKTKA